MPRGKRRRWHAPGRTGNDPRVDAPLIHEPHGPNTAGADGRLDGSSDHMYSNPVHITEDPTMPRQATYTYVRENLARLLEEVESKRDVVIINRRGHEDVALVPAGELESLVETAHLLRSPKHLGPNMWSRRLTAEHRVVYLVRDDRIDFLQARYHY